MRPRFQVIGEALSHDAPQVSFVEHDDMVEALAADRTAEVFAVPYAKLGDDSGAIKAVKP